MPIGNGSHANRERCSAGASRLLDQIHLARKTIVDGFDRLIEAVETFDRDLANAGAPPVTCNEALLERAQAAEYLNVSMTVLGDWVSRGIVPHKRLPAGSGDASRDIIRFDKTELRRWLDERTYTR